MLETKDSHLKGAIGELVAWKYLIKHFLVGGVAPEWTVPTNLDRSYLTKQQRRYLKMLYYRSEKDIHRWDLLAMPVEDRDEKAEERRVYLVDVKTGVPKRGPWTLRDRVYKNYREALRAKSSGFIPIIVKVELADDWTFNISSKEL